MPTYLHEPKKSKQVKVVSPRTPTRKIDNEATSNFLPTASSLQTTPTRKTLKFDDPHPDGSPHRFFNWVDPDLAHKKDSYQEIEIQIK